MTGGNKMRGLSLVQSYKILAPPDDQTPENIKLAQIMGWCLEIVSKNLTTDCYYFYTTFLNDAIFNPLRNFCASSIFRYCIGPILMTEVSN